MIKKILLSLFLIISYLNLDAQCSAERITNPDLLNVVSTGSASGWTLSDNVVNNSGTGIIFHQDGQQNNNLSQFVNNVNPQGNVSPVFILPVGPYDAPRVSESQPLTFEMYYAGTLYMRITTQYGITPGGAAVSYFNGASGNFSTIPMLPAGTSSGVTATLRITLPSNVANSGTLNFRYNVLPGFPGDDITLQSVSLTTTLAAPATPTVITSAATCAANGTATIVNYNSSYTYTFSPVGPSVGAGGVISGMTPGTSYTVRAILNGCQSAASASFNIANILTTPVAPTITTSAATCSTNGTATVSNYNASYFYTFSPAGPSVGAGGVISGMTPGTSYTVRAIFSGCQSLASASFSIAAMQPTPTTPFISAGGTTTFCTGGNVALASSSATGNQWYRNGTIISGATSQNYIANVSGTYTVIATTNGCSSAASAGTIVNVTACCNSGTIAPALASTTINGAPATVADLIAALSVSNQPANTVLTIHSASPATDSNKLSSSTSVIVGSTYYVAFWDNSNSCYSPTSAVTIAKSCGTTDSDGDGIFDLCDLDDDNDGILDCVENGLSGSLDQSFKLMGDATVITSPSTGPAYQIQLTPDGASKRGQTWSYGKVDFTKSFKINMKTYISNGSVDADGMAIVFHNSPAGTNAMGTTGQGLGARGILNGIALELDIFPNSCTNDANNGGNCDPTFDHGTIRTTAGWVGTGKLTGDVQLGNGDIGDNTWHNIVITWDANSRTISYTFEGAAVTSYSFPVSGVNSIETILGGTTAYFGYTASTGANYSKHIIGFDEPCQLPLVRDTDGDGIPDHLDLDSDNDGCLDAIEGSASFTISQLVNAGGSVNVGIGSSASNQNLCATNLCVNAQGVPALAGAGQGIGSSQNVNVSECPVKPCAPSGSNPDSDGDGISDMCDVDDDNDGILDTAECSNTITDLANAYSGGSLLNIVPSDFGLALNVKNQNVTKDLSSKFGYPANSGAVVISITNASVHPGADAWWTKNGEQPSRWKVTGTLSAFVLMAQDTKYYSNDSKTIHIYDGAPVIPITFPGMVNQTAVASQWNIIDTVVQKTLTDLNTDSSNIELGNWRYANMEFGSKDFGFSTTTAFADPTYAVLMYLECDSDRDGIPNRLDLDSDADGCSDTMEGGASIIEYRLVTAGGTISGGSTTVNQNLCATSTCVSSSGANSGLPQQSTTAGYSNTTGQSVGNSQNAMVNDCLCYESPEDVNAIVPVKHGITALERADRSEINGNWPMLRNSAYTVLEAKTKGFVVTRTTSPETTIAIPIVGMMVFDTDEDGGKGCLKIYTGSGVGEGWKCFTTQGCPPPPGT